MTAHEPPKWLPGWEHWWQRAAWRARSWVLWFLRDRWRLKRQGWVKGKDGWWR